jgi:hypothetical protein
MKRLLTFILLGMLIAACEPSKKTDAKECISEGETYLVINGCKYFKIKIGEHDVYQYTWEAKYGTGSDIIHFEDMCDYCKNK